MISIELEKNKKSNICESILRTLPDWFGIESAILDYISDVQDMTMFVATENQTPIGFLALNYHNQYTAEIHVMGVLPSFHRKSIGKLLVQAAEIHLRQNNFKFISVKTLSESRPNKEYEQTRKFYLNTGFIPIEEFKTLWGEHNPCLLLVKTL